MDLTSVLSDLLVIVYQMFTDIVKFIISIISTLITRLHGEFQTFGTRHKRSLGLQILTELLRFRKPNIPNRF